MRFLRLYEEPSRTAVECTPPLGLDRGCNRCSLAAGTRTVCMPAESHGGTGGLLVVGDGPSPEEDRVGRPSCGVAGQNLRALVRKYWTGPITLENAVRCSTRGREMDTSYVDACRGYLAQTIREVKPSRIIAMGKWAAYAVLGRSVSPFTNRRSYAWMPGENPAMPIPVFILIPVASGGGRNTFIGRWVDEDFARCCSVDVGILRWDIPWHGHVRDVQTRADALEAVAEMREHDVGSFDTEYAGGLHRTGFEIVSVSLCGATSGSVMEDPFVWDWQALKQEDVREPLFEYMRDASAKKVAHNGKADQLAFLCGFGLRVKGVVSDTRLLRKVLEPESDAHLDVMNELVGMGGHKEEAEDELQKVVSRARRKHATQAELDDLGPAKFVNPIRNVEGSSKTWSYALLPPDVRKRYVARDSVATAKLHGVLDVELRKHPNLVRTWDRLVFPAEQAAVQIEEWGIGVDRGAIAAFERHLLARREEIRARLDHYGKEFNPNSHKQLTKLLYDDLKLPIYKRSKKTEAPSTDEETLLLLRNKHPVVADVLDMRGVTKFLGTYAQKWAGIIRPDGRIHSNVDICGTRTGRASVEDGLHQVPRAADSPEGKLARDCFVAEEGNELFEIDYSRLEICVAGMLSGDEKMLALSGVGRDYHLETAKLISRTAWGMAPEQITGDSPERNIAKCFHPDTEVLTRTGWKRILDLVSGEEVVQAFPGKDFEARLEWCVPLEIFTRPNPHDHLVHLKNEGIDLRVTPNHRMLGWSAAGNWDVCFPENLPGKHGWANAGILGGSRVESPRLLRLAVATQADGSYNGKSIRFGFTRERKRARLARLLTSLKADFSYTERPINGKTGFFFTVRGSTAERVRSLLDEEKQFPWSWLDLTRECRSVVLEEASYWDGHRPEEGQRYSYSSTRARNLDVLQAIAATMGRKTRLVSRYCGSLTVRERSWTHAKGLRPVLVSYTGEVACLSVPSSFVLVRDGKAKIPVVTGQTLNFGILYGEGAKRLALKLNQTVAQAERTMEALFGGFPGLRAFVASCVAEARSTGCVWTWWDGHPAWRRPLYQIVDADSNTRAEAERQAFSTKNQGCLPAHVRVSTRLGYLPIGGIPERGETWTGTSWAQYKRVCRGSWELAQLELANGVVLDCDTRHEVLVETVSGYQFVAYKELRLGDRVCLSQAVPREFGSDNMHALDAYWMGYATGNGYAARNTMSITMGDRLGRYSRAEKVAEWCAYIARCGFSPQKPQVKKGCTTVSVEAAEFRRFWEGLGYSWEDRARTKKVPGTIYEASLSLRRAYLLGYLDADGSAKSSDVHSPNDSLLREMQLLLRSVGVESLVSGPEPAGAYYLHLHGAQAARVLGYGSIRSKEIHPGMLAPRFLVEEFLSAVPEWKSQDNWPFYVAYSKLRHGGSIGLYALVSMAKSRGVHLRGYAVSPLVEARALGTMSPTYTLSLEDPLHRFDSMGVISKNTGSHYLTATIIAVIDWIRAKKVPAKLVLPVHDSLLLEVRRDLVEEVGGKVKEIMLGWNTKGFPFGVDMKRGPSWGALQKMKGV